MKLSAKSIVVVLLAASLALLPLGCSQESQQNEEEQQSTTNTESSAESQPETDGPEEDPNRIIDVEVVESETNGETTVIYTYDEKGRLTNSESSTLDTPLSGSRTTYDYDELGRVSSAVTAMEYIEWGDSYQELFTYDDAGNCITFASEILGQGDGASTIQFVYDEEGRPISAALTNFTAGMEDGKSTIEWTYTDDGHIQEYGTTEKGYLNETLTSSAEQLAEGVYVYENASNTGTNYTEIHCDPNGRVDKVVKRGDSYQNPEIITYTYTTIQVIASEWIPSIYSNPTGFPSMTLPQLSEAQIAAIKGE